MEKLSCGHNGLILPDFDAVVGAGVHHKAAAKEGSPNPQVSLFHKVFYVANQIIGCFLFLINVVNQLLMIL
jgi:hypothetical protein